MSFTGLHRKSFYIKNTAFVVFFSFVVTLGVDTFHFHKEGKCEDGCSISTNEYSFFDYLVPAGENQHESGCCVICTSLRNFTKEFSKSFFNVTDYFIEITTIAFLNESFPPFYEISTSSRSPPLTF